MILFIENPKFITKFNTHSVTTSLATEPISLSNNHSTQLKLCVSEIIHYLPQLNLSLVKNITIIVQHLI